MAEELQYAAHLWGRARSLEAGIDPEAPEASYGDYRRGQLAYEEYIELHEVEIARQAEAEREFLEAKPDFEADLEQQFRALDRERANEEGIELEP